MYSASNLVASLKYTVKAHKAAGDVEWRPLHATVKTPLTGGMKFITWLLKPALRKLPHLVVNSEQVVRRLQNMTVIPSARLIKIDIRDFFMEGDHLQLIEACSSSVESSWRAPFRSILRYILDTQYVKASSVPGRLFKVKRGAGMGLLCSGEVCDMTFYKTVEEHILQFLQRWGITEHCRFRDDIFIVADGGFDSTMQFIQASSEEVLFGSLRLSLCLRLRLLFWM